MAIESGRCSNIGRTTASAAADRHALRPHLAAGPARHRRRGRHERLHRRGRPAAGRRRRRGRDLHPGHLPATCPPVVELAPGVLVRHVIAGPFEGLAKEDLPGQLCAFTAGVLRAEAARRAGLVRPRPLALLALRAGRLAGQASAGACRSCTPRTPWPRSRTPRWPTGDRPGAEGPGDRRGRRSSPRPTGWSPTPASRPATWSTSTAPTRPGSSWSTPGVDLDRFRPPGDRAAAPGAAAGAAGRRGTCSPSSAGSSR